METQFLTLIYFSSSFSAPKDEEKLSPNLADCMRAACSKSRADVDSSRSIIDTTLAATTFMSLLLEKKDNTNAIAVEHDFVGFKSDFPFLKMEEHHKKSYDIDGMSISIDKTVNLTIRWEKDYRRGTITSLIMAPLREDDIIVFEFPRKTQRVSISDSIVTFFYNRRNKMVDSRLLGIQLISLFGKRRKIDEDIEIYYKYDGQFIFLAPAERKRKEIASLKNIQSKEVLSAFSNIVRGKYWCNEESDWRAIQIDGNSNRYRCIVCGAFMSLQGSWMDISDVEEASFEVKRAKLGWEYINFQFEEAKAPSDYLVFSHSKKRIGFVGRDRKDFKNISLKNSTMISSTQEVVSKCLDKRYTKSLPNIMKAISLISDEQNNQYIIIKLEELNANLLALSYRMALFGKVLSLV
eukprot:TRINITY_DN8443_c0_g1_i1.p1 TRINITY_DN8443_c0_g1~~TRINITY_DN8443_c0_g1_i1.p1  ORF type:complete len:425 (-),score=78.95 TRINITY_DN8443_c0_g1_i1:303-1526(-)